MVDQNVEIKEEIVEIDACDWFDQSKLTRNSIAIIDTKLYDDEDDDNTDTSDEEMAFGSKPRKSKMAKRNASTNLSNVCRGKGCMCFTKFASREEVRHHYIDKGCFRCRKCHLALGSRRLLRIHLREDHQNGESNAPFPISPVAGHRCRISKCDAIFDSLIDRDQHEKDVAHFNCEPCDVSFHKALELSRHRRYDNCKGYICSHVVLQESVHEFTRAAIKLLILKLYSLRLCIIYSIFNS